MKLEFPCTSLMGLIFPLPLNALVVSHPVKAACNARRAVQYCCVNPWPFTRVDMTISLFGFPFLRSNRTVVSLGSSVFRVFDTHLMISVLLPIQAIHNHSWIYLFPGGLRKFCFFLYRHFCPSALLPFCRYSKPEATCLRAEIFFRNMQETKTSDQDFSLTHPIGCSSHLLPCSFVPLPL